MYGLKILDKQLYISYAIICKAYKNTEHTNVMSNFDRELFLDNRRFMKLYDKMEMNIKSMKEVVDMSVKIQDIIDVLTVKGISRKQTVDGLEFGTSNMIVKGIATTFLATQEIIEKARELGVNLIITHEGIFYSHWNKRKMFKTDPVYIKKCQTIKEAGIAIFRYHDYIHDHIPDGIMMGLLKKLDWKDFEVKQEQIASIIEIPAIALEDVILYIKNMLNLPYVRFMGDLKMSCSRICLLVGYRGNGDVAINLIRNENPDLFIYGEGPEWETPEYIRDSMQQGRKRALIVLGHAESEAPGMEYLACCLKDKFPDIPVYFINEKPVFNIL